MKVLVSNFESTFLSHLTCTLTLRTDIIYSRFREQEDPELHEGKDYIVLLIILSFSTMLV